jgi:hypothetical protein
MIAKLYAVRLDETSAARLAEIRAHTGETISDVLKRGLLSLATNGVKQPVKQEATFPTVPEPVKQPETPIVKQYEPECLTMDVAVKQPDAPADDWSCRNPECPKHLRPRPQSVERCPSCRSLLR